MQNKKNQIKFQNSDMTRLVPTVVALAASSASAQPCELGEGAVVSGSASLVASTAAADVEPKSTIGRYVTSEDLVNHNVEEKIGNYFGYSHTKSALQNPTLDDGFEF